jgi:hypothetical protein
MLMFAETDEICKHAPRVPISREIVKVEASTHFGGYRVYQDLSPFEALSDILGL